jgi:hypothetical protein
VSACVSAVAADLGVLDGVRRSHRQDERRHSPRDCYTA